MADLGLPTSAIFYSLMGGILPALFWLWFWCQEDKLHPEPRGRLLLSFIGGMLVVPLVYPLQKLGFEHFGGITAMTLLFWAIVEEIAKYVSAGFTALRSRDYDEPIDAPIYLVTTALGFAALENALFILTPLLDGQYLDGAMVGNMRFIGASLLHVVCSGVLGYCIGREFYRSSAWKLLWRVFGLSLAIALHTVFNLFIIDTENGSETFLVFSFVWVAAIAVLLLFEQIKKIKKT